MEKPCLHLLAKSPQNGGTTLVDHTAHVVAAAEAIADYLNVPQEERRRVRLGAVFHDLGKASQIFQGRLAKERDEMDEPFRHELASLFFLPLLAPEDRPMVIDMIVAHHRSPKHDVREQGLLDLFDSYEEPEGRLFELHFKGWEEWSPHAMAILAYFEVPTRPISHEEAYDAFYDTREHCRAKGRGCSLSKGLLVAADHLASAAGERVHEVLARSFRAPNLSWYHDRGRQHQLYPLSHMDATDARPHTLVTAPTGAGKTDFLLRRCRGRVFYVLPFQASINAMFLRLRRTVPGEEAVRLQHAASRLALKHAGGTKAEGEIQDKVGAPLKVLTPHQVASIALGTKGYEAALLDLSGCDIILDEIHTYAGIMRSLVLRLVEVLTAHGCRIHVGTATMPSSLRARIRELLGPGCTYSVALEPAQLDGFDRHIVRKLENWDAASAVLADAVAAGQKVLLVVNQVERAQKLFDWVSQSFSEIPAMLIHSRFRRGDRANLEEHLTAKFDHGKGPCIVVSTQVVEVSLDISFDVLISDAAPLDSLIQRFGRVNRRRSEETICQQKEVYVVAPPKSDSDNLPYQGDLVRRSYEVLPNGEVLREREVQALIDAVFGELYQRRIDHFCAFRDGKWMLKELNHHPRSVLLESLEIEAACCIRQSDVPAYRRGNQESRTLLEVPVPLNSIQWRKTGQLKSCGNNPFVVPDDAYDHFLGLRLSQVTASLGKVGGYS